MSLLIIASLSMQEDDSAQVEEASEEVREKQHGGIIRLSWYCFFVAIGTAASPRGGANCPSRSAV